MKNFFSFLALAVITFFIVNCSGDKNTPAGIEKAILSQIKSGNYDKAAEITVEHLNLSGENDEELSQAELLALFTDKAKESNEKKGGLKSFKILEEKFSDDGLSAVVSTKSTFGDGTEDTNESKYAKGEDGKWYLSFGK